MLSQLFANTVYVKVYQDRFEVRHVESGTTRSVSTRTPFSTARLLIGQYTAAEEALSQGLKAVATRRWFSPAPMVLIQPMEKLEGGLSQVEERVLRELSRGAGARTVHVWVGHELTDREVLQKSQG